MSHSSDFSHSDEPEIGFPFNGLTSYNTLMTTLNEILRAATSLTPSDRVQLISELWDTVSPEDWASPSPEWIREVQRRSVEIDAGKSNSSPWSDVRARARQQAGLNGTHLP